MDDLKKIFEFCTSILMIPITVGGVTITLATVIIALGLMGILVYIVFGIIGG